MNRREAVLALLAIGAAPRTLLAQQRDRVYRVATIVAGTFELRLQYEDAVRERLAAHGFVEGRNLRLDSRPVSWIPDQDLRVAKELAAAKPDAIFVMFPNPTRAAQQATTTVPIVFAGVGDAVENGFVKDYARPGGNITGVSNGFRELLGKRLELVREVLPKAKRVAQIAIDTNVEFRANEALFRTSAERLGFELLRVSGAGAGMDIALANTATLKPDAVFVWEQYASAGRMTEPGNVRRFAAESRIPFVCPDAAGAELGALFSYGVNFLDDARRGADQLARVLQGANPAELPVDQAMRFELVVNLRTARALGLAVPRSIFLRADRVIE